MPSCTITRDGNLPAIPPLAGRTVLILQNNTTYPARFRIYGPVSSTDTTKSGLLLADRGGCMIITGPAAALPVYCITAASTPQNLDYEADK